MKRWSLTLLGLGFGCLAAFRFLGGDGEVRTLPLVPVGWFSISLGLILGAIHAFGSLVGGGPARSAERPPDGPDEPD